MRIARRLAPVVFVAAAAAGTLLDQRETPVTKSASVLVADLHVHPFPGDGGLSIGQLRREAFRRGVDVVGVTAHNNQVALRLATDGDSHSGEAIVLPGQEVTAPGFHLIALGIRELIDWRLPLRAAADAIHRQGGVAIAAHPIARSWTVTDDEALAALDGIEVAHPMTMWMPEARRDFDHFFARVRSIKPSVSPIGSSDFHVIAPLGRCRTYLFADRRTGEAALEAIRRGRTVAQDEAGTLYGSADLIAQLSATLGNDRQVPRPTPADRTAAAIALVALAALAWPPARRYNHGSPQHDYRS